MNVNASGSMQQMRKMDGSGNGMGHGAGNGMRDIMQSLSTEDRTALKTEMSTLPQEERAAIVEQMKQIDRETMDSAEYFQALLDIFTKQESQDESVLSVYA